MNFCPYAFKNSMDSQCLWGRGSISSEAILVLPRNVVNFGFYAVALLGIVYFGCYGCKCYTSVVLSKSEIALFREKEDASLHPSVNRNLSIKCNTSLNFLVFHTSGGISSSPAAFLFLIFLSTDSSSSRVNGPRLMSNCLLIIIVIGSSVTFDGFLSRFSKCCFHSFIRSCWLVAFSLALAVLFLLLTLFIIRHAILDCLSSTESLILWIWFCMYSVCSFRYMFANSFCAFFYFQGICVSWVLLIVFGGSFHVCSFFSNR